MVEGIVLSGEARVLNKGKNSLQSCTEVKEDINTTTKAFSHVFENCIEAICPKVVKKGMKASGVKQ